MNLNLKEIFIKFDTDGTFCRGEQIGNGHIHDTYKIETAEADKDNYLLQKINNRIFTNIPELQGNIERVTAHLRKKLTAIGGSDIKRECLNLVPALNGKSWIIDNEGNFWRMFLYINDYRSYDMVDSEEKAFEGGKAVGRFQAMLSDMPSSVLYETIPRFHDIESRLTLFKNKINENPAGRAKAVTDEINNLLQREKKMKIIHQLGKDGKIPVRITHNDTKFNNILLDLNNKALCIIDLDTVMPGYIHYDFGDAIRTAANSAAEDEPELSKIEMNSALFEAYSDGYLTETRETLNYIEKEYLAFAPLSITYTIAVRFLTDYLDGDKYFKIHHSDHNLQRTRAQIKLLMSMEDQYESMKRIISKLC